MVAIPKQPCSSQRQIHRRKGEGGEGQEDEQEKEEKWVDLGNGIETMTIEQTLPGKGGVLFGRWSLMILLLGMPVKITARQLY